MTSTIDFDWSTPYPSARLPVFARNIVSTSHPLAAQAGLRMMQQGGNAVDAAIADRGDDDAGRALQQRPGLRLPSASSGTASSCTASMPRARRRRPGRRTTSAASTATTRRSRRSAAGIRSPCPAPWPAGWPCPSASASCRSPTCWRRRSRSPSAATPCRSSCRQKWVAAAPLARRRSPAWPRPSCRRAGAPEVGERFAFPAAARSLRAIAETRGAALYGGEIAEAAAKHAAANGGAMTVRDFAAFEPEWVETDRASTTAAIACTRSRPTARASPR